MARLPTPTQEITHPLLSQKRVRLFMKRDDLIHPYIMGNKWRKLYYNLQSAKASGQKSILTMGGAFSNHIAATAAAAKEFGFHSVGIIRGQELKPNSNPTLLAAQKNGMQFHFVSREQYREWRTNPQSLKDQHPNHYFLPEGGTNALAIKGCKEIINEIEEDFDVIATPIGTGGTFAGLISGSLPSQKVLGISCLKGEFIFREINDLLADYDISKKNFEIINTYHAGGYGKVTTELIDFINWFKEKFGVPLDPIYTGKSVFGVWDMIKSNKFEENLKIVLLHTGGLQGIEGFNRKSENIIQ